MARKSSCTGPMRKASASIIAIVGEPTSRDALGDMIKIGRRGSLNCTLIAEGRQGHAAYPRRRTIHSKLMRLLTALTAAPLDTGTPHFQPSNLEIVSVDVGNPAFNVIPAEARARFNIRFNDLWTPETLAAELRRRLDSIGEIFTVNFEPCNAVAFLTKPGAFTDLVAKAVERKRDAAPCFQRVAARRTRASFRPIAQSSNSAALARPRIWWMNTSRLRKLRL